MYPFKQKPVWGANSFENMLPIYKSNTIWVQILGPWNQTLRKVPVFWVPIFQAKFGGHKWGPQEALKVTKYLADKSRSELWPPRGQIVQQMVDFHCQVWCS
jgi:hypothetical protein